MIAEPYICVDPKTTSYKLGQIIWARQGTEPTFGEDYTALDLGYVAQCIPYADFEREKLKELKGQISYYGVIGERNCPDCRTPAFFIKMTPRRWLGAYPTNWNSHCIQYTVADFLEDSESSRLLKRAAFLKAVCEKEGVEWLPKKECGHAKDIHSSCCDKPVVWTDAGRCSCSCHKEEKMECIPKCSLVSKLSQKDTIPPDTKSEECSPPVLKACDCRIRDRFKIICPHIIEYLEQSTKYAFTQGLNS